MVSNMIGITTSLHVLAPSGRSAGVRIIVELRVDWRKDTERMEKRER